MEARDAYVITDAFWQVLHAAMTEYMTVLHWHTSAIAGVGPM